jgi:hypothetical protein
MMMKKSLIIFLIGFGLIVPNLVTAQNNSSIGSGLGLFIFPGENQSQEQQDADEVFCFNWAKQQTGYDPMNPTVIHAQEVDKSADGSTLRGAAGGAAAGAAIGAISGDAGEGAAIGAILGALGGAGRRQAKLSQQKQYNEANAAAQTRAMKENFIKGFSACLEAKGYTIK